MCLCIRIEDYILTESLFLDVTEVLLQKRWTRVNKATGRLMPHAREGGGGSCYSASWLSNPALMLSMNA